MAEMREKRVEGVKIDRVKVDVALLVSAASFEGDSRRVWAGWADELEAQLKQFPRDTRIATMVFYHPCTGKSQTPSVYFRSRLQTVRSALQDPTAGGLIETVCGFCVYQSVTALEWREDAIKSCILIDLACSKEWKDFENPCQRKEDPVRSWTDLAAKGVSLSVIGHEAWPLQHREYYEMLCVKTGGRLIQVSSKGESIKAVHDITEDDVFLERTLPFVKEEIVDLYAQSQGAGWTRAVTKVDQEYYENKRAVWNQDQLVKRVQGLVCSEPRAPGSYFLLKADKPPSAIAVRLAKNRTWHQYAEQAIEESRILGVGRRIKELRLEHLASREDETRPNAETFASRARKMLCGITKTVEEDEHQRSPDVKREAQVVWYERRPFSWYVVNCSRAQTERLISRVVNRMAEKAEDDETGRDDLVVEEPREIFKGIPGSPESAYEEEG